MVVKHVPSTSGQPQPPILDLDTLRERLFTGGGGASRGSLSRCARLYRDFVKRVLSTHDDPSSVTDEMTDEIEAAKQVLQRELRLHALEMRKLVLVAAAAEAELARYDAAQAQIESDTEACRKEIEELKVKLTHEKRVRRNREEYESLAKVANARPAKRRTAHKLDQVRREIGQVKAEEARSARELEVREKQFQLLMQSILDLKANLAEDLKRKELEKRMRSNDGDEEVMDDVVDENAETSL
mmetsp:Transcript_5725/g.9927  ORF Transcript_5725/g.9927 Transcript_5725/m.9927 type:complete len:242 (-) Transcript_5725:91-816(-)